MTCHIISILTFRYIQKLVKNKLICDKGERSMDDEFVFLVLSIVDEIPKGRVASYRQIAKLAGYPKNARKVGKVLSNAALYGEFPCHRVIHSDGTLVEGWSEQQSLLEKEGIVFYKNNRVSMRTYQWQYQP